MPAYERKAFTIDFQEEGLYPLRSQWGVAK